MSQDEIAVMDGGKCILQLRGVRPFLSEKFDITKHPRYKYLADADKKNSFHLHHTFPDRREGSKSSLILKKAQDQEVQPCPVYDQALEGRTAGVAGKAQTGRAERPGEI